MSESPQEMSARADSPAAANGAPSMASLADRLGEASVNNDELDTSGQGAPEAGPERPSAQSLLQNLSHAVEVKLADQQADKDSPLYSVQSFEDLHLSEDLLKGIYKMGFLKPSKIQEKALPLLLQDPPRNLIAQSQSGTGKTAAFVLTMLSRIDFSKQTPQAICVAPARELATQIVSVVQEMGQFTPVKTFLAAKGVQFRGQQIDAHLIVGTPGTLLDMSRSRGVLDLRDIKVLVLDEADNMLTAGQMGDQSIQVKNAIMRAAPGLQILLFSATFADDVRGFAQRFAPNANEIRLKQEELSLDAIKQFFMDCKSSEHRFEVLVELYALLTIGQSIIFVKRRDDADEIARRMTAEGHKVVSLHGMQEPAERDQVMSDFKTGRSKVLISTNVIARGIDVLQVNVVVNYDLPTDQAHNPDVETYIHRIGRTGRFGRQGLSINFVYDRRSAAVMSSIERALGRPVVRIETSNFEQMEKTLKAAIKA